MVARARVERLFPESTIVCLGSGPSLTLEDVEYCRGKAPVIAVNDTYRWAPWADVLYAADTKWWEFHRGAPDFAGLKFSIQNGAGHFPGVTVLENAGSNGLELEPTGVRTGKNSGYQAINLAVHLGAKRIVLLGYDMQAIHGKGRSHFFGDHTGRLQCGMPPYAMFVSMFTELAEELKAIGVSVINCTRETALKQFPRRPLREVLA